MNHHPYSHITTTCRPDVAVIHRALRNFLASRPASARPALKATTLHALSHAFDALAATLSLSPSADTHPDNLDHHHDGDDEDEDAGGARALQTRLADAVVSRGGLNDAALAYLDGSPFRSLVETRYSPPPGAPAMPATPTTPAMPATATPSDGMSVRQAECTSVSAGNAGSHARASASKFDAATFLPTVVGNGRLAAAFLTGFHMLGVPESNITVVTRRPICDTGLQARLTELCATRKDPPDASRYLTARLCGPHPTAGDAKGPLFLLVKRGAFDDAATRAWVCEAARRASAVVNLMAGGSLRWLPCEDVVLRASVLVCVCKGSFVVAAETLRREAWRGTGGVRPVVCALGRVFEVERAEDVGPLTFFSSTVPLVLAARFDEAAFGRLEGGRRAACREAARERAVAFKMLAEGAMAVDEGVDRELGDIVVEYMNRYHQLRSKK